MYRVISWENTSPPTTASPRGGVIPRRAKAQRDRQRAHEGRHRGHHDRPEAQQRSLIDRFRGAFVRLPLLFERNVNHHDGVLFHDAYQHDHAHEPVKIKFRWKSIRVSKAPKPADGRPDRIVSG